LLFELVATLAPERITFLPASGAVRLRLHFRDPIDAVAAEIEDESGERMLAEAALRHRPVATRQPDWFHARVCDDNAHGVDLTICIDWLGGVAALARLLVRPQGCDGWRPLRNARGDSIALALADPETEGIVCSGNLARRFETLCRWFSDCYDAECWLRFERNLLPRWQKLGEALYITPGGSGRIMRAAALPPPDHAASSWIPILHPVQFIPEIYAASPSAFAALATSGDPGVAEMSALATLNTVRLREMSHLHPTVYLAFRNLHAAHTKNVPFEGFDPARFFKNLLSRQVDSEPKAGWFWRGAPLLGPDHWRAAHLRLVERLITAKLFVEDAGEEGPNSHRQEDLQRLMHTAWTLSSKDLRPPAPCRSPEVDEPDQVDIWASALLSEFARTSRSGQVVEYVGTLSQYVGMTMEHTLTGIAFMLRLAPELFAFHLLLWQIARERP